MSREREHEAELRLAHIYDSLRRAQVNEDGQLTEESGGFLSALDYAVRGHPGCLEPLEFQLEREHALERWREELRL